MNTNDLLNDILYWMEFSDEDELLAELKDTDPRLWPDYTLFAGMFSRSVDKLEVKDEQS